MKFLQVHEVIDRATRLVRGSRTMSSEIESDSIRLRLRTDVATYAIVVAPRPGMAAYLGCIASVHGNGGNDLPDGNCTEDTWTAIADAIERYDITIQASIGVSP